MAPVDLVALAATLGVLWTYYRREVPRRYDLCKLEAPDGAIRDRTVFRAAFLMLALLLGAYFILAPLGVPVAAVTGAGALALLALAGRWFQGRGEVVVPVGKVLRVAPWGIVVLSLGMYLVVYGLRNAGLTDYLAAALVWLAGHGAWAAAVGTGFGAALLSSVMNNMPGVLVGALSIKQAEGLPALTRELMVYANIIGCDLGPKFTPMAALRPCCGCTCCRARASRSHGDNTCAWAWSSCRRCCCWRLPRWRYGCQCWADRDGGTAGRSVGPCQ